MGLHDKRDVGKRITQLIESLGYKSNSFAVEIGMDAGYLSKVENGHRLISGSYLDVIVEKFNVNKDWVLLGKGEMFSNDLGEAFRKAVQKDIEQGGGKELVFSKRGLENTKEKSGSNQEPDSDLLTLLNNEISTIASSLDRLRKVASSLTDPDKPKGLQQKQDLSVDRKKESKQKSNSKDISQKKDIANT